MRGVRGWEKRVSGQLLAWITGWMAVPLMGRGVICEEGRCGAAEWEVPGGLLEGCPMDSWWGPWDLGRSRLEVRFWDSSGSEWWGGGGGE